MTPVVLVGLMVAAALILAITWVEPRVLGGPAAPAPSDAGMPSDAAPAGEPRPERALEPVASEEAPVRLAPSRRAA